MQTAEDRGQNVAEGIPEHEQIVADFVASSQLTFACRRQ